MSGVPSTVGVMMCACSCFQGSRIAYSSIVFFFLALCVCVFIFFFAPAHIDLEKKSY